MNILKKSFKKLVISCLLLISIIAYPNEGFSQGNYKKGFIVTLEKDTISTLINYKSGMIGNNYCLVKEGKIITQYKAKNILAFGFDKGNSYESSSHFKIAGTVDSRMENEALKSHVFYELLVKGKITLYKYGNRFYAKNESGFYELFIALKENSDLKPVYINGRRLLYENSRQDREYVYKDVLKNLLIGCPDIEKQIDKTGLNDKSLTELLIEYNRCVNSLVSFRNKNQISKGPKFIPELGFYTLKTNFNTTFSSNTTDIDEINFKRSNGVSVGFSFLFKYSKNSERLFYRLRANYVSISSEGISNKIRPGTSIIVNETINIDFNSLMIDFGLQYKVYKNIYTGVSFGYGINSGSNQAISSKVLRDTNPNLPEIATEERELFPIKKGMTFTNFYVGYESPISEKLILISELRGHIVTEFDKSTDGFSRNSLQIGSSITGFQFIVGLQF